MLELEQGGCAGQLLQVLRCLLLSGVAQVGTIGQLSSIAAVGWEG
jgi:hypothetical protein